MNFNVMLKQAAFRAKKAVMTYGPSVCTVAGCIGVAATGVLAWKGRAKCDDILAGIGDKADAIAKIKYTSKAWLPPVIVGGVSCGAIILSHTLSKKQITALLAINAANTGIILQTKESIDKRLREVSARERENGTFSYVNDEDRQQAIFESDCDLNIVCLDPDGRIYWDDYTGIWFRQKPEVVEKAYSTFNGEYSKLGWVSIYRLYELFGFGKSDWAQTKSKHKYQDIGFERYIPFDNDKDFIDQYTAPTGEDYIYFRETCGKRQRTFGIDDPVKMADWSIKEEATRITYSYTPHVLYKPYMTACEFDNYMNASLAGNMRFTF